MCSPEHICWRSSGKGQELEVAQLLSPEPEGWVHGGFFVKMSFWGKNHLWACTAWWESPGTQPMRSKRCVYVHTYVVAIRRNKWLGLPEWMTGWCGWWVVWNAHPCREADLPVGGGGDRWEQSSSLSETELGFQTKLSVAPWEISGSLLFGCRLHFKFRVKYSYENEKLGYSSGEENLFQHSLP